MRASKSVQHPIKVSLRVMLVNLLKGRRCCSWSEEEEEEELVGVEKPKSSDRAAEEEGDLGAAGTKSKKNEKKRN